MTLGANDKKKLGFLAVLGLVALYGVYSSLFSGPSTPSAPAAVGRKGAGSAAEADSGNPAPGASTPSASQPAPDVHRATPGARPKTEEFRPALHSKRKEEQIDPLTVDPTLRTDLLAKVQDVKLEGGQRNLFQFGPLQLKGDEPVVKPRPQFGPFPVVEKAPEPVAPPVETPPTPVTFKYYGLSTTRINGKTTAFFLEGEGEIILATEGMIVKKRYKIVRIGATSVVLEDVDSKKQQTVKYTEEAPNASGG